VSIPTDSQLTWVSLLHSCVSCCATLVCVLVTVLYLGWDCGLCSAAAVLRAAWQGWDDPAVWGKPWNLLVPAPWLWSSQARRWQWQGLNSSFMGRGCTWVGTALEEEGKKGAGMTAVGHMWYLLGSYVDILGEGITSNSEVVGSFGHFSISF
jgi:hypothetical protein